MPWRTPCGCCGVANVGWVRRSRNPPSKTKPPVADRQLVTFSCFAKEKVTKKKATPVCRPCGVPCAARLVRLPHKLARSAAQLRARTYSSEFPASLRYSVADKGRHSKSAVGWAEQREAQRIRCDCWASFYSAQPTVLQNLLKKELFVLKLPLIFFVRLSVLPLIVFPECQKRSGFSPIDTSVPRPNISFLPYHLFPHAIFTR